MKRFFKKLALWGCLTLTVFLAIKAYVIKTRAKDFDSAFVDKLRLLANDHSHKKIILLGGSSVGFSMSAALIQQETGIKTINLGQHAGLGLTDAQSFILGNLTDDDIILFSPEWNFYEDPRFFDQATLDNLIDNNLDYDLLINKPAHVLQAIFSAIRPVDLVPALNPNGPADANSVYRYNCLNANGDIISHCNLKPGSPSRYDIDQNKFNVGNFSSTFPFIKRYNTLIVFPPTQTYIYQKNKTYFERVENTLRGQNLRVLDHIADNVYADSCFFNAEYHLTCENREIRTQKIIDELKPLFGYLNIKAKQ